MVSSDSDSYYIICEDLFKIYKIADIEVVALRGLDLAVEKGELMAVVGASGSGKTTLLNILGGLDTPTAGKVIVGGRDLIRMTASDIVTYRRQDIGFVWQRAGRNVVPYLTAFDNVELPLILLGWSRRKRRRRVEEILTAVGLAGRMRYRPEHLSGGEQQRLAIAVALAHNPPLLLADEPTGELDSQASASILEVFRSLNETYKVTIVIVTHDTDITDKVQRIVTIRDGRTSLETIWRPKTLQAENELTGDYDEFVVLDSAGRLQLPREYLEKLKLKGRVRLIFNEDHITIWSEENPK